MGEARSAMHKPQRQNELLAGELNDQFVDMLIASHSLRGKAIEGAFREVPRHHFVDQFYILGKKRRLIRIDRRGPTRAQLKRIFSDEALVTDLRRGTPTSSTSQPTLVAMMLVELQAAPGMKVLEIGAGTGWNAALIGHIVGPRGHVHSVDIQADIVLRARRHLQRLGTKNVTVVHGDGGNAHAGWRLPYPISSFHELPISASR